MRTQLACVWSEWSWTEPRVILPTLGWLSREAMAEANCVLWVGAPDPSREWRVASTQS